MLHTSSHTTLALGVRCLSLFGIDKKRLVSGECVVTVIKGRPCPHYYFFSLRPAVCGFSEHFNLLSSRTRGIWPCPLVTSGRLAVVNIRWGLCRCKGTIQSAFRTIPDITQAFQLVVTAQKWVEGLLWQTDVTNKKWKIVPHFIRPDKNWECKSTLSAILWFCELLSHIELHFPFAATGHFFRPLWTTRYCWNFPCNCWGSFNQIADDMALVHMFLNIIGHFYWIKRPSAECSKNQFLLVFLFKFKLPLGASPPPRRD